MQAVNMPVELPLMKNNANKGRCMQPGRQTDFFESLRMLLLNCGPCSRNESEQLESMLEFPCLIGDGLAAETPGQDGQEGKQTAGFLAGNGENVLPCMFGETADAGTARSGSASYGLAVSTAVCWLAGSPGGAAAGGAAGEEKLELGSPWPGSKQPGDRMQGQPSGEIKGKIANVLLDKSIFPTLHEKKTFITEFSPASADKDVKGTADNVVPVSTGKAVLISGEKAAASFQDKSMMTLADKLAAISVDKPAAIPLDKSSGILADKTVTALANNNFPSFDDVTLDRFARDSNTASSDNAGSAGFSISGSSCETPGGVRVVNLVEAVARHVQLMHQKGDGSARLQFKLEPEHLGEVTVKLDFSHGRLNAQFIAASHLARDAIDQALAQLRENLAQHNVFLDEATVSAGEKENPQFQERGTTFKGKQSHPGDSNGFNGPSEEDEKYNGLNPLGVLSKVNYLV